MPPTGLMSVSLWNVLQRLSSLERAMAKNVNTKDLKINALMQHVQIEAIHNPPIHQ